MCPTEQFYNYKEPLPDTSTLYHKRDINKNDFNSEPSKANLQVRLKVLHNDGSLSDKAILKSDPYMTVSHNYMAPIYPTYETPNNIANVDVSVPFKLHQRPQLSSDTMKNKIKISEEGENNIYDVPSEIKEERTVKDNNTSTTNCDDITEHPRRYRKHEALRIRPDFHDVQLITNPSDLKKCSGTSNTYRRNETYIAHSPDYNYATSLTKHLRRPKQNLTLWNDIFSYSMNELNFSNTKYFSNPYVIPDGKGCSYTGAYLLIRPSRCYLFYCAN